MKVFLASWEVTRDARALFLAADLTCDFKSRVVQSATKRCQCLIICFKPDLVVPIDTSVMDPLTTFELYHSAREIITHEAVW